jgi:hypothetical protein
MIGAASDVSVDALRRDPSGRYFVPLYLPLSIFAAMWLDHLREGHRQVVEDGSPTC